MARRLGLNFVISALLLGTCLPLKSQSIGLAGTWAVRLGERNLIVLTLAPSAQKGLTCTGTFSRAKHFTSNDSEVFSKIESGTVAEPVVTSEMRGDMLFIQVQNPKDPSDKDGYLVHIDDPMHVALHPAEAPEVTIHLVRAANDTQVATDWDAAKTYSLEDGLPSNPEMKRIFDEDQAPRSHGMNIDWKQVAPADAQRRAATMKLLHDGALHTGEDFTWAAFIFQHGDKPDDFLLAHTLAMVAVKKGYGDALWIGTATLDRYLQSIRQPQIYGTQFNTPDGSPTTQEPYDRNLISDALRKQLGVPVLEAQDKQREQYDKDRGLTK